MKIHLNQRIVVDLTDTGIKALKEYYRKHYPSGDYESHKHARGWSFPLWQFIHVFKGALHLKSSSIELLSCDGDPLCTTTVPP